MKNTKELLNMLTLTDEGNHNFSGISAAIGSPNVFGGQVLAQALNAASRTLTVDRNLHSLHAYFLEAGDLAIPIGYHVEVIRDGGSFSTRRVTAQQNNKTIFILACSFHKEETGYAHQISIKKGITEPEDLMSWDDMSEQFGDFLPKKMKSFLSVERPISFKPVEVINPFEQKNYPPLLHVWFKLKGNSLGLSLAKKQQILTYISDYNILTACLYPNASVANYGNTQMASLDHSMWFYRDFDFSDWMLFAIESPSTCGARGFARGNIFTRDGKLVASVAQEGLMRPFKNK